MFIIVFIFFVSAGKKEIQQWLNNNDDDDDDDDNNNDNKTKGFKVLWDFNVQYDRKVEARRSDIIFVDKQAIEAKIIDIAIPGDARVRDEELEKIENYHLLSKRM